MGKFRSNFAVVLSIFYFCLNLTACKDGRPNKNISPAVEKDCSIVNKRVGNKLNFHGVDGSEYLIPMAYLRHIWFDGDCRVKSAEMFAALIDGELSPWNEIDNSGKEISSAVINTSPTIEMLLSFDMHDERLKNRTIQVIRRETRCSPRLEIPELGIEYFSRLDCSVKVDDYLPQFIFSDSVNKGYIAKIQCNLPSELELKDIENLNQLNGFSYYSLYGCRGHGLLMINGKRSYKIGINYLAIRSGGKPHVDVTVKMISKTAEVLIASHKK